MEKIEVRYAQLGAGLANHKYIVWTDSQGVERAISFGPTNGGSLQSIGSTSDPTNLPKALLAEFGGWNAFGNLDFNSGTFNVDNFSTLHTNSGDDPAEVITTGSDLSATWGVLLQKSQDLSSSGVQYLPLSANSNTAVDYVLALASLTEPADDGLLENWSPGSDRDLAVVTLESDSTRPTAEYIDDVSEKFGEGTDKGSPLVLDMDGDGVELTSLTGGSAVYWDVNNDGFAEASGWVSPDDALLAIDLNEDGIINNSSELFGDQTGYSNGFLALQAYDSNEDGYITSEDSIWSDLRVWLDTNSNGYSESAEMHTLDSKLISSINLQYSEVSDTIAGNSIMQESTFTINGGTNDIVDAYFVFDTLNTVYDSNYTLHHGALYVADLRGYGKLPDLHVSISQDYSGTGNLLDLVSDLNDLSFSSIFDESTNLADDIANLMYRWAGVDDVSADSRGPNIDARKLEFLEAFTGQEFFQRVIFSDPGPQAAHELEEAFLIAFNNIYARLVVQSSGGQLFTGTVYYDLAADVVQGVTGLDATKLGELETEATALSTTAEKEVFWQNVVRMIEHSVGVSNLPAGDQTDLDDAITASDATLDITDILDGLVYSGHDGNTYTGTSGNDTLTDSADDDTLDGLDGNDTLTASTGNDILDGGLGDDVLTGGVGYDYLLGSLGDDEYHWDAGDGDDTIREAGAGTGNDDDRIVLGSGFDSGDLTITRVGNTDLVIDIDNGTDTGQIIIENQFNYASGGGHVELIEFSDTSTYRLDDKNYTLTGTSGADELRGVNTGGADADTIYGGAGNDEIYGYAPNQSSDTATNNLYGEDGDDELYGGIGTDYMYGGADDDYMDGNAGDDVMDGGVGDDYARGDSGDDEFIYTSGHDTFFDNSGSADKITLAAAYDSVTPSYFRFDDDLQIYWDSDNTITISDFYGSNSIETMVYDDTTTVTLSSVSAITQGGSGNDTITGTTGDDIFYGNGGDDALNGGTGSNGNDTLYGGTGDDTLRGGYGDDYLVGGAGDDDMQGHGDDDHYVYTSGHDTMKDLSGDDILEFIPGWEYGDLSFSRYTAVDVNDLVIEINASNSIKLENQFYSGNKTETLRMNDGTGDVTLTSLNITSYGDSGNNTMNGVVANAGEDDIMYGLAGNDTLRGKDGADTLYGGDGDDTVDGDAGNDILDGGSGDDTYYGDAGDDLFVYTEGLDTMFDNSSGTDTLWLTGGITADDISIADHSSYDAKITINSSVDEIIIDNLRSSAQFHIETIKFDDGFEADLPSYGSWMTGTASNDAMSSSATGHVMLGYGGNDTIQGFGGNDTLYGGAGNDTLEGGDDDDFMHGGIGDDLLYGEDGLDTMFGGAGADTFFLENTTAFNDIDVIKDFDIGTDDDVLDISDILDNTSYVHGTDDITDWLEITDSGSDSVVKIDTTGAGSFGVGTQVAKLEGITGLTDEQALITSGNLIAA